MGEGGVGMGVWECFGPWVKGFKWWVCVSIGGHGWKGLGMGVWALAMGEGSVGMVVWDWLGPWVKGFRGWVCVSIGGHGWKGLGMGVCVWAMGEGSVGMGVWECLNPYIHLNWFPRISNPYCRDIQTRKCEWSQGYKMTQTKLPIKNS